MKKLLIVFLLFPLVGFGQLGNFYNPNGHLKAKGLNFKIKSPLGFEQKEANRPNIVQKWTKGTASFMIMIRNLDAEIRDFPKKDWIEYLKYGSGVSDFTSELPNVSNQKYYVIDSYPGIYCKFIMDVDRADLTFQIHMIQAMVFLEKQSYILQLTGTKEDIKKYSNLFTLWSNSVVLLDQYKN